MLMTIHALLPVILVIATGYLIARTGLISGDQWHGIERLTYFVLFPAILFKTIALMDFSSLPTLSMGATLLSAVIIMAVFMLALRPLFLSVWGITGPRFTSIFQGVLRWNGFIALAVAAEVIGANGVALVAVAMVVMIPILNVICVLVLSRYADGEPPTAAKILRDLYTNPFILSILAGLAVNLSGVPVPTIVQSTLAILGRAALPVAIICVGAGLDLAALRRPGPALTSGTLLRLLGMPLLAAGFAMVFGVTGPALAATIIAASVPSAGSAYVLAKQMGGDAKLMAEILTLQTVAAMVTIPLMLYLLT
ncbi:AEC family transporter [uncultured Roseibium sp.]|uniref:AEC family transporter n=1 Tax=uncultured Roseibium sp. TaxID=1936171 RepID=UPI003216706C